MATNIKVGFFHVSDIIQNICLIILFSHSLEEIPVAPSYSEPNPPLSHSTSFPMQQLENKLIRQWLLSVLLKSFQCPC